MNERAKSIIEALDQSDMTWKGRYDTSLTVNERRYKLSIIEHEASIEVEAWLPVTVDDFRLSRAQAGVDAANNKLTCGQFHLDEKKGLISFRMYDLDVGTSFTAERMSGLLVYCRQTLETYAEPLCEELSKTVMGRFLSVLGFDAKEA